MSENFFLDNPDLQFRLEQLDLREVVDLREDHYAGSKVYPTAPRNYADAKDSYRIVLDVLGEVCGERVAPRAAEADEEGAHYESGEVTYAAATRDAIEALRQAELFGAMLSREYGGLNLPLVVWQFWGRAAEASWTEKSRTLFLLLAANSVRFEISPPICPASS